MQDRQRGDRTREADVEASQPGPLVGLTRHDASRLNQYHVVELETLRKPSRYDVQVRLDVTFVASTE